MNDENDLAPLLRAFDGKTPVVEVFHECPDNTFICAVVGAITVYSLQRIEHEVNEVLDSGEGIYRVKCTYNPASFVDGGFREGDYWDLEVVGYDPLKGESDEQ